MFPASEINISSEQYPLLLKQIHDPPPVLFVDGDVTLLNSKCLAIVGTRKATRYGKDIARKFAKELAQCGFTIVSGLAEGIDTEAHKGALECGGRTIAVFGCGLDRIFPSSNVSLANEIARTGALISELPPGHPTAKWTFPRRNRIISGLSKGVLMVEGHYDSGAMITAKHAIDEGREVFAIPGDVALEQSKGPHWLIKQGAKLVEDVNDILEEFDMARVSTGKSMEQLTIPDLSESEAKLLKVINKQPKHIDDISNEIGKPSSEALSMLSMLEIKGLVIQVPGKYFTVS